MKHINTIIVFDDIIKNLLAQYGTITFLCIEYTDFD